MSAIHYTQHGFNSTARYFMRLLTSALNRIGLSLIFIRSDFCSNLNLHDLEKHITEPSSHCKHHSDINIVSLGLALTDLPGQYCCSMNIFRHDCSPRPSTNWPPRPTLLQREYFQCESFSRPTLITAWLLPKAQHWPPRLILLQRKCFQCESFSWPTLITARLLP